MPASRTDERFLTVLTDAADAAAERLLGELDALLASAPHHRAVMKGAKGLIACYVHRASQFHRSSQLAAAAARLLTHLAAVQGDDGLFDGENLSSPPDTAFTVNDLCDAYALAAARAEPDLAAIAQQIQQIALATREPLLHGGVHTPNHRWELCAALARLHRHWPDPRLPARIDEWLGEGVDIAPDGMYSERSANYAAFVTNPSLITIGLECGRPELLDHVCRNLDATMAATLPDGTVETVHSRRQDQNPGAGTGVLVDAYLMQFRRFAISRGRSDYARVVEELSQRPPMDPATALTEVLLEPQLAAVPPQPADRSPARTCLPSSQLAVVCDGRFALTVYGGSDYSRHGRIRSGLANNPTFLRMMQGDAVLDGVRLSRSFFGRGPFRADGLAEESGVFVLREETSARYYGPLRADRLRADGSYELADDGRFSASMDFTHRPSTAVTLSTELRVRVIENGAEIAAHVRPARVDHTFELTFRAGGTISGVRETSEAGCYRLVDASGAYRCGDDVIEFGAENHSVSSQAPRYEPGEDYTQLGGTDSIPGIKVYIGGGRSGTTTLRLRAATVQV